MLTVIIYNIWFAAGNVILTNDSDRRLQMRSYKLLLFANNL